MCAMNHFSKNESQNVELLKGDCGCGLCLDRWIEKALGIKLERIDPRNTNGHCCEY